jgi:hypothetical protein
MSNKTMSNPNGEREAVVALLKRNQRSMSWLAKALGVNRQSVQQWLVDGVEPRDRHMWDKMKKAILGMAFHTDADRMRQIGGVTHVLMRYAGEVPCGSEWGDPLSSTESLEVDMQFDHHLRFAARVVGDSCYPALLPGDLTIWHVDMNPPYGMIVLAQRKGDHGCTVKSLEYDEKLGRPRLLPVNPASGQPEDGEGWGVIARLVAVIRSTDGLRRTWFMDTGLRAKLLV